MDKLEFDDRIRRLERRASIHSAVLAAVVLVIVAAVLFVIRSLPRESSTPATTQFVVSAPTPPTATMAGGGFIGGMSGLEADLRKAHGLMNKGLITLDDFAAKKAMILERPLDVLDFAEDIKAAKRLADETVLTGKEYETLKKTILKSGRP